MPYRKPILATGEFYHIFSRSIEGLPIFEKESEINYFLEAVYFYLETKTSTSFSSYRKNRKHYPFSLLDPLVQVIAYCIMPNHFHFILYQVKENGIKTYLHRLLNSYAHYFNLKRNRHGVLFETVFRAVRIESEEQLIHLSRYIHLNPTTACLVEHPKDYQFSSCRIYLGEEKSEFVKPEVVISCFSSSKKYEEFLLSQKDYQRQLNKIKHLLLE